MYGMSNRSALRSDSTAKRSVTAWRPHSRGHQSATHYQETAQLCPCGRPWFTISRMRKVVLGLGISLDGYIARPDGAVDFLFMPKDYSMGPFFATIDTAVIGRKTYDVALKMGGGSYNGSGMKTSVFSHSQPPGART